MLSKYFKSPSHIRALRNDPYGSRIEGFAAHLSQIGYSKESACQHIRSAELVILWADHMRLCLTDIDKAGLQSFGDHLVRRCGGTYCRHKWVNIMAGARLFLRYLHGRDRVDVCTKPTTGDSGLWSTFCTWMTTQRGTCEATLRNYEKPVSKLIRAIGEDMRQLDALLLRRFVIEETRDVGWVAAKHTKR